MTIVCCVCGKVRIDWEWVEVNTLPEGLLSHTYCEKCFRHTMLEIEEFFAEQPPSTLLLDNSNDGAVGTDRLEGCADGY